MLPPLGIPAHPLADDPEVPGVLQRWVFGGLQAGSRPCQGAVADLAPCLRFDHVPAVLDSLGVERVFHKVAQRPGKPFWFGIAPGGQPVFALPGNPVSTLVCLVRYVVPALARLEGAPTPAVLYAMLATPCEPRHSLTAFLPVDRSLATVTPRANHGSGDFSSLAGTDGFIELSPDRRHEPGEAVPFYTW